ncbi:hypothetical protein PR048_030053 [Dryococelus australis]|uniref:sphingomyelin phosphodiesterase n=1 Tax=Dryococelus australis TaxID=614101 RepID=A0ABQ9G7V9_9NEOP|nr:hypothetical protein PR048_030053 [Dryococelus australis]
MVQLKLNVLTLNCWGIPVGSSHRIERMNAIAEELDKGEYDLVCLQEVWLQSDYWRIRQKTSQLLPFAHYFYSGVLGSGVCILSKFPIDDVFFHQWPVNGYIHKIHHGDWFGGKGVGLCQVSVAGIRIHVYTTHLHAEYNRESDEYMAHRVLQAFDLSQMVRTTSVGADVVILAGDLNTEPEDLAQRIICQNSELHDAYMCTHQSSAMKTKECAQNSLNEEIISNGTEVSQNHEELLKSPDGGTSRRSSIPLWAGFQQDLSKRIDYILFRSGPEVQVRVESYRQPLPQKVPNCSFSFSDHEAVLATLRITKGYAQTMEPSLTNFFFPKFIVPTLHSMSEIHQTAQKKNYSQYILMHLAAVYFVMYTISGKIYILCYYFIHICVLHFALVLLFCVRQTLSVWCNLSKLQVRAGLLVVQVAASTIRAG